MVTSFARYMKMYMKSSFCFNFRCLVALRQVDVTCGGNALRSSRKRFVRKWFSGQNIITANGFSMTGE